MTQHAARVRITPDQLEAVGSDAAMLQYMRTRLVVAGVPAVIRGIELTVAFGKLTVSADHDGMTYTWVSESEEVAA